MYYTPRPDELPESAPDIAFLLGEDDAQSPVDATGEEDDRGEGDKKPVRVLHDWSVFDARPRPKKRGDLALPMLPLDALDTPSSGSAPEGAGVAAPLFENDEDAGQEDDGDYDDEGEGEEEAKAVSVRLRLGALLRYTVDYTKLDEYAPLSVSPARCSLMAAQYSSRPPRRGTSSECPRVSIARTTRRSSARTRSRRRSCVRSSAMHTCRSRRLSASSKQAPARRWRWAAAARAPRAICRMPYVALRHIVLS